MPIKIMIKIRPGTDPSGPRQGLPQGLARALGGQEGLHIGDHQPWGFSTRRWKNEIIYFFLKKKKVLSSSLIPKRRCEKIHTEFVFTFRPLSISRILGSCMCKGVQPDDPHLRAMIMQRFVHLFPKKTGENGVPFFWGKFQNSWKSQEHFISSPPFNFTV